ncbi:MAG: hypothetical protein U1F43_16080 [Myxococcota bacterium]
MSLPAHLVLALAPALGLGACASTSGGASGPGAATYARADEVQMEPDDASPSATVRSCFSAKPAPDGAIAYGLEFLFAFGHECSMSGVAAKAGPGVWVDAEHDNGCRLTLAWQDGGWSLSDPDGHCREEYCGARGHLEQRFTAGQREDYDAACGKPQ